MQETYQIALLSGFVVSLLSFVLFQVFPRQIISLFGKGTEEYYQFGVNFFRIFLFCTILNFLQPITSTFFTSIGKPKKGIFLSLTRQILFLLPLIFLLPLFLGIDGLLYAGLAADLMAAVVTIIMAKKELNMIRGQKAES